jgi:DNA-binding NarL/FixJ family response regulator
MRVGIADDTMLIREGVAQLLTKAGFDVTVKAADADELLRLVALRRPDAVIVDIKMPPTHTDEGLLAADAIRASHPDIGVLVLSQYLATEYALRLLERHPEGVGYLLKERVSDIAVLADALSRVAEGESVLDPTIVSRLLKRRRDTPLADLTERERDVLALMAEGQSNKGICAKLFLSPKTVEAHVGHIFSKLGLRETADQHRRVVAVITYLRAQPESERPP